MSPYGTLFEDLKVAIFDWLHQSVNMQGSTLLPENHKNAIPIFRAESDAVRPEGKLHIEYKFLTGLNKVGSYDELLPAPGNTFLLRGQREFTVSVNILGNGAPEYAALIQQKLDSPSICDLLRGKGLAVRNNQSIADQSVFLETSFEERAVLDVIFGMALELADAVSYIETIEITSNIPPGFQTVVDIVD